MIELTTIGKSATQLEQEAKWSPRHKEVIKAKEDANMSTIIWLSNALNGIITPGDKRNITDPYEINAAKKYLKSLGINCGC